LTVEFLTGLARIRLSNSVIVVWWKPRVI